MGSVLSLFASMFVVVVAIDGAGMADDLSLVSEKQPISHSESSIFIS